MEDCLPADTPMEEKLRLTFPANPENNPSIPYRSVIGKLLYIALSTRPDIAYAVCYLCCFVSNYGREHWSATKCILQYLHKTIDHRIVYSIKLLHEDTKERLILHPFCNSDYADNLQTSKSVTGCVFFYANAPILWMSCLQKVVALSSCKAEYYTLSEACKHALYLSKFLGLLNLKTTIKLIKIYCNNTSAITLAMASEAVHNQVKHVRTNVHHLRKMVANGYIKVEHKPTATMTADLLTKSLSRVKFTTLVKLLQVQ